MNKLDRKEKRRRKVRSSIVGTSEIPRLSVNRSNKYIFAQLVDDTIGATLLSVNENSFKVKGTKVEIAFRLGEELAKIAKSQKISKVVFDRGSYIYHGRVRSLADGARKGGLKF